MINIEVVATDRIVSPLNKAPIQLPEVPEIGHLILLDEVHFEVEQVIWDIGKNLVRLIVT